MNKKQTIYIREQEPTPINVAIKYIYMYIGHLVGVSEKNMVVTKGKEGKLYVIPLFSSVSIQSPHLGFKHKKFDVGTIILDKDLNVVKVTKTEQIERNIRKHIKKFYEDIIKDIKKLLDEIG